MRSTLHKATCQWPLPSSHLLCESSGVIRAPSCIFHHAGSCCGTAMSMGTAEGTTWTNWGLNFSTLHSFLFLRKAVIEKINIYCITFKGILLHTEADNNPSSIWMRAEGHQLFDSYPMLSAGWSIPLAVCSLCAARMGKTGFFQQSKIRLLWKSFHSSRQGRQQSWKREGVGSRKKDPSNLSSWRKRPSSLSGQDKACKENKRKTKAESWPNSPHEEPQLSCPSAFCFLKPHPSRGLSIPGWWGTFPEPCWNGPLGEPQDILHHLLRNLSAS